LPLLTCIRYSFLLAKAIFGLFPRKQAKNDGPSYRSIGRTSLLQEGPSILSGLSLS
jgi:hypothetical protein